LRTTVEIPDDLFRKAKAKAALEGIPLRDLVIHGLRLAMAEPAGKQQALLRRAQFPLIKARAGREQLADEQVAEALAAMDEEDASLVLLA
jgi:hypothetical protein